MTSSNIKKLCFISFILLLSFFVNLSKTKALTVNSVDLDLGELAPGWNINETWTYTFTNEEKAKNYSHMSAYNDKLYVFIYDKKFTKSNEYQYGYQSDSQALKVNIYNLDRSNSRFVYSSSTSWNGNCFAENYVIWSSYDFILPFPDVSEVFNTTLEKFSDSTSQDNILFTINTFKNLFDDMPFLILYNKSQGIYILYTPNGTDIYGDGTGSYGGSDTFNWRAENGTIYAFGGLSFKHFDTITHSQITTALNSLKDDIDNNNISTNQSFGGYGPQASFVPIYHSNGDSINLVNSQWTITWNGTSYPDKIPTLYENLMLSDYEKYFFYSDIVKTVRVHFTVPEIANQNGFLNYRIVTKEGSINSPWIYIKYSDSEELESNNSFNNAVGSEFSENYLDSVSLKPTAESGYLEIDISSMNPQENNILTLYLKSEYITNIEIIKYSEYDDDQKGVEVKKDVDGKTLYIIDNKKCDYFKLEYRLEQENNSIINYNLRTNNVTNYFVFDRPKTFVYDTLHGFYDEYDTFEEDSDRYEETLPDDKFTVTQYNTKAYLYISTALAQDKLRLKLLSGDDYVIDYVCVKNGDESLLNKQLTLEEYSDNSQSFLNSLSLYTLEFSSVFSYLFNGLDPFIQMAIISLFIIFIITSVIIMARK